MSELNIIFLWLLYVFILYKIKLRIHNIAYMLCMKMVLASHIRRLQWLIYTISCAKLSKPKLEIQLNRNEIERELDRQARERKMYDSELETKS